MEDDSISTIKRDVPALSEPPAKRASSARNRQPDEDTIVSCPECGHQCPHSKIINHLKRCTRKMAPSRKKPVKPKPVEVDVKEPDKVQEQDKKKEPEVLEPQIVEPKKPKESKTAAI